MTDQKITESYEQNGYVVVDNIIDEAELDPMRNFIKTKVDEYAREQYAEGKLSSLYEEESFTRRYAAICEEQELAPRGWHLGSFGREFYDLYKLPRILHVIGLILGPEVSNIGDPALRTKLPGSEITSFPWHQDSQYVGPVHNREEGEAHGTSAYGHRVGAACGGDDGKRLLLGHSGESPLGLA